MLNKMENNKFNGKPKLFNKLAYNLKLRKYMLSLSPNRKKGNKNGTNSVKDVNRLGGATITDFYYKNPFFYNEENLNLQLKVLKELKNIKFNGSLTPMKKNQNQKVNTNLHFNTKAKKDNNESINFNKKFGNNNTIHTFSIENKVKTGKNMLSLDDPNPNFPNIFKKIDKKSINLEINDKVNNDDKTASYKFLNPSSKRPSLSDKSHTEKMNSHSIDKCSPVKLTASDNYFYKIVFKSKPLFRMDRKVVIDNKLNMKYAENEEQYQKIIEREYKNLRLKGKKVKSKNISPSIKLKLSEAKNRIHFMKGIMDYSYPGFVLSKIKMMQKKLNEQKKESIFRNHLSQMELREKEKTLRNNSRKEYLLKSITLFK